MGAVISLVQPVPATRGDWSQQEVAEFYRVEAALVQAGMRITTERGLTDEDDPWFVFCYSSGDPIMHFARIDGSYVIGSDALDTSLRGPDFRALLYQLAAQYPALLPTSRTNSGSRFFVHPAALLAAIVASAAFSLWSDDASASELIPDGVDAHASAGFAGAPEQSVILGDLTSQPLVKASPSSEIFGDENRNHFNSIIVAVMIFAEGAFTLGEATYRSDEGLLLTQQEGSSLARSAQADASTSSHSVGEARHAHGSALDRASVVGLDADFIGREYVSTASAGYAGWLPLGPATQAFQSPSLFSKADLSQPLQLGQFKLGSMAMWDSSPGVPLIHRLDGKDGGAAHGDTSSAPPAQSSGTEAHSTTAAASSDRSTMSPEHSDGASKATLSVPLALNSPLSPENQPSQHPSAEAVNKVSTSKSADVLASSLAKDLGGVQSVADMQSSDILLRLDNKAAKVDVSIADKVSAYDHSDVIVSLLGNEMNGVADTSHGQAVSGSAIGSENATEHSATVAKQVEAAPQDAVILTAPAQLAPAVAPADAAQAGSDTSHGQAASGSAIGSENATEHSATVAKQVEAAPQDAVILTAPAQLAPVVPQADVAYDVQVSLATKQPSISEHVQAIVSDDGSLIFEGDPSPNSSLDIHQAIGGAENDGNVRLVGLSEDLHLHDLPYLK